MTHPIPNNFVDAWREGARCAIRKLADKPQNFLTDGFRERILMRITEHAIEHRKLVRAMVQSKSLSEAGSLSLSGGFKEGARFVFEAVKEYDIGFLTDKTMADSIMYATAEINKVSAEFFRK